MTMYLGDYALDETVYFMWNSFDADGASVTRATNGTISVYKDNNTTQTTTGVTDTEDFDSLTGVHQCVIDTSDAFYTTATDFMVVLSAATIDGQTVNAVLAHFSIENRVSNLTKVAGTAVSASSGLLNTNVTQISGDSTAADNLESYTDGTTPMPVNAAYISGDLGAADNLELAYDGTGYAGGTTPQQVVLTTSGVNAVADQVWDELISGHVAAGSAGATIRASNGGTAAAGGANTITLGASASAVDDYYNKQLLKIVDGTGQGQSEFIEDYVGATKVATMAASWHTQPDSTSVYVVTAGGTIPGATAPTAAEVADAVLDEAISGHTTEGTVGALFGSIHLHAGTAQAGSSSSLTFDATGSSTTVDFYKHNILVLRGGTGAGQSRQITAYSAGRVATVTPAWTTTPDSTSEYVVIPLGIDAATPGDVADAVWDEARTGHGTAGTFGEYVFADAVRISGDATAADQAESAFDGTGFAFTGCTMPEVTTVTGNVDGNVGGNVVGSVGSVAGNVDGDVGGNVVGTVASVVGSVGGNVTGNVGGNVTGSVGSLAAQAKADVNAEVLDVLNTDTFAEPGQGAPAATTTIIGKIGYIYKAWRNKVDQTSSEYKLYNDDASTVGQKATVADDGTTLTRGEVGTGA